jgi:hypothetical protein
MIYVPASVMSSILLSINRPCPDTFASWPAGPPVIMPALLFRLDAKQMHCQDYELCYTASGHLIPHRIVAGAVAGDVPFILTPLRAAQGGLRRCCVPIDAHVLGHVATITIITFYYHQILAYCCRYVFFTKNTDVCYNTIIPEGPGMKLFILIGIIWSATSSLILWFNYRFHESDIVKHHRRSLPESGCRKAS